MKQDQTNEEQATDFRCCLCGKMFEGYGNNPYPVQHEAGARCCDTCNATIVMPARFQNWLTKQ